MTVRIGGGGRTSGRVPRAGRDARARPATPGWPATAPRDRPGSWQVARGDRREDEAWMARALALAEGGQGTTSPNPMVGAVLVRGGRVVGEGFHAAPGRPHAEAEALAAAGPAAVGATCYVTLEPCVHHGRTPPCADALVDAGVARVVAAVTDPDPHVRGAGFARLRAAGIEVAAGVLAAAAEEQNAAFLTLHPQGRGQPRRQGRGRRRHVAVDHRPRGARRRPPPPRPGGRDRGWSGHGARRRPAPDRPPRPATRPAAPAGPGRRGRARGRHGPPVRR